ncbi:Glu/Leu/Phe/Val dehydrogenase dimerization domain-containing protein [Kiloniella sp.]|uniref:Glu/Leu/Phe/Val dehydrogenase family protein n=1 Tax=Kiloniella sp. TaxID=1938587 RepID=UPI003B02C0BD
MTIFDNSHFKNHTAVHYFFDQPSGLRAIIAIHSLGTANCAIGGARMYPYATEDEALSDALNLSQGMSLKSAMAQLPYGGAKAVIIGDPKRDKTPRLLAAFADCVDSLKGTYKTSEDIGINLEDLKILSQTSSNVVGAGAKTVEPAVITSLGVFAGIKAACKYRYANDSLDGKTIAVQGIGKVGMHLCERLYEDGASLIVSDIDRRALTKAQENYGAQVIPPKEICAAEADVFAPCAFGGSINAECLEILKADIIAGSANNQLENNSIGEDLKKRDILYAPDFVINAGGLIDVAAEIEGYNYDDICQKTEAIGDSLGVIFQRAKETGRSTNAIAIEMAREREIALPRSAAE